eukprot:jgi/Picre1/35887/NNA_003346.t1
MGLDGDGLSDTASSMTVQEPSYVSEDDAYSLMGLCKEINRNAEWSRLNAEKRAYLKQMAQAKAANSLVWIWCLLARGNKVKDAKMMIRISYRRVRPVMVVWCCASPCLQLAFVIGPGGQSVRDISEVSVCKIQSWTETVTHYGSTRRVRKLVLDGKPRNVAHAVHIIKAAVARYKDLCEGNYCNQLVDPVQHIMGVEFIYQPPPRKAVPHAAGITTKPPKQRPSRRGKENICENSSVDVLKCLLDDTPLNVSSEPKQSDFCSWSGTILGDERQRHVSQHDAWKEYQSSDDIIESSGIFSNDSLGMSEVPCDQAEPALYSEQKRPYSASQVSAQAGYHLFADNAGHHHHLKSYPWAHVDMLRDTSVESLLHPRNASYYQGPLSVHMPTYRDRVVSSPQATCL